MEGGVSLLDDVVEGNSGGMLALQADSLVDLAFAESSGDLFGEGTVIPELVQEGLM